MMRKLVTSKWTRWSLISITLVFGILPGGCETTILRWATPLLL